jgi:NADH dehydrogenase [ubiquinone] 1 alpha subcomplex assembly factor 1
VILFDFTVESECASWRPINDVVMGGLSESRFEYAGASTGVFTGTVSLKNSGGFASVRISTAPYDLQKYQGLKLRVRGDGKEYKINLKDDPAFDGVQYQATFEPKSREWCEITIPFADLIPMFRGRSIHQAAPLNRSSICTFGFLISGKQEGLFRLEIDWIGVYP